VSDTLRPLARVIRATVLCACALLFVYAPAASSGERIRVALLDNRSTIAVSAESGLLVEHRAESGVRKMFFTSASIGSRPVRIRAHSGFSRVNGKNYRGWLEVRKKKNGLLLVVNELDIEDYLQSVVTSEIPHDWSFEALKAQAVAARTYALYQKKAADHRLYHVLATVNSQVYRGGDSERPRGARAVRDTRGLVILYRGELINAFYHSSCGGHTENAGELWGIDEPYLKGVDCECQEISRYGLWERRIGKRRVLATLRKQGIRISDVVGMGIKGVTAAGRVKGVSLRSSQGERLIPAETMRAALGTAVIPSVFFELELDGNEAVFSGRGAGHGVGLCQWGAEEMAERGYDFKAILAHYYPGTAVAPWE